MERMLYISFRKHREENEKNKLLILINKVYILFAHAIITSTTHASSVFVSSFCKNLLALLKQ